MAPGSGIGRSDRAYCEVAAGHPHLQTLVGPDLATIHDDSAVGMLDDRVPAFQCGQIVMDLLKLRK